MSVGCFQSLRAYGTYNDLRVVSSITAHVICVCHHELYSGMSAEAEEAFQYLFDWYRLASMHISRHFQKLWREHRFEGPASLFAAKASGHPTPHCELTTNYLQLFCGQGQRVFSVLQRKRCPAVEDLFCPYFNSEKRKTAR